MERAGFGPPSFLSASPCEEPVYEIAAAVAVAAGLVIGEPEPACPPADYATGSGAFDDSALAACADGIIAAPAWYEVYAACDLGRRDGAADYSIVVYEDGSCFFGREMTGEWFSGAPYGSPAWDEGRENWSGGAGDLPASVAAAISG